MPEFIKIQEYLKKYNPESERSLAKDMFAQGEFMVSWFTNNLCNFSCAYCGNHSKEHPSVGKYSIEHITESFKAFGHSGHIIMSGGEPFLFPSFVELCKSLTKDNYISINTNLSARNVPDFAASINPEKVVMINAGIHLDFRKSKNINIDDFIINYKLFQDKGFNIVASYVVKPEQIGNLAKDINFLKSLGINNISAKSFRGVSMEKNYPQSYTKDEIKQIEKYMHEQIDMPEYLQFYNYKGRKCSAGKDFFSISPAGDVRRCFSDETSYGNIFENTFKPLEKEIKCTKEECICPFPGMIYSKKTPDIFVRMKRWF